MTKAAELAKMGEVLTNSQIGGRRNIFINGAMQVFQRGTSFTNNGSAYNADRWSVDDNQDGGGQSTDAPNDFNFSLKINPGSGLNSALRQAIELPSAGEGGIFRSGQKFTLSFYLKSDNAGEAINIFAASGTSVTATTTSQVNDTSTGLTTTTSWARYTYTFTSNNVGGSDTCYNIVPYVTTPSGAVYWTGFQLELGSQATPFEHRSFGEELALCQRYFQAVSIENGGTISVGIMYDNGTGAIIPMDYKGAKMRVAPTITMPSTGQGTGNVSLLTSTSSYPSTTGSHTASHISDSHYSIRANSYSGLPNAGGASWFYNNGDVVFQYDSEL